MLSDREAFEKVFGFENPLWVPGDEVHPFEDSKEFRIRWRTVADQILETFRKRLPSAYDSSIPSTIYDAFLRSWSEEMARLQIEGDRIRSDVYLDTTRGKNLFQKWGYVLHVNSTVFPRSTFTEALYRTFLTALLRMYLGGARKDVIQAGLREIYGLPVTVAERVRNTADIGEQFKFDVSLIITDLDQVRDIQHLFEDATYVVDLVKPAHTLFSVRVVILEAFDVAAGCLLEMGEGYFRVSSIETVPERTASYGAAKDGTIEGQIDSIDLEAEEMVLDGILVKFNSGTVSVASRTGLSVELEELAVGMFVYCLGYPVGVPLTEDGFVIQTKVSPGAICERVKVEYKEWNYDDFRRSTEPVGPESYLLEQVQVELTSYGTVRMVSLHKPFTRGHGDRFPPVAIPDGSGGIRVWYKPPQGGSINVTSKVTALRSADGEIEVTAEDGITQEEAAKRYWLEYYFKSREVFVLREPVRVGEGAWPIIRVQYGPIVAGNGTPDGVQFDIRGPHGVTVFVNGRDETDRVRFVRPLIGEIEFFEGRVPTVGDVVEVSYWYWVEPVVPFVTNVLGRSLNCWKGLGAERFVYTTVMPDFRTQNWKELSTVSELDCVGAEVDQIRYEALDQNYSSLLNDPTSLKLNNFSSSRPSGLNVYDMVRFPSNWEEDVGVVWVGSSPYDKRGSSLFDDVSRKFLYTYPGVPIHASGDPTLFGLEYANVVVEEGTCGLASFEEKPSYQLQLEEEYAQPEDSDHLCLNDWGVMGIVEVPGEESCCSVDPQVAVVLNMVASRLNWAPSILTPGCVDPIPMFSLIVDETKLCRRGLNYSGRVLFDARVGVQTEAYLWYLEEFHSVQEDGMMSLGLGYSDSFPRFTAQVRAFLDGDPVPWLQEF